MTATQCRTVESVSEFCGLQPTLDEAPWFGVPMQLWTLTETLTPRLVAGSTMTRETIEAALEEKGT